MLRLTRTITFTHEEQRIINSLMATKRSGNEMWNDSRVKPIKHRVNDFALREQKCLCAYCEDLLCEGNNFIEHFVPKGLHREFTFEPANLMASCGRCNSTTVKGKNDTIKLPLRKGYSANKFAIVHPRLNDPNQHIVFKDAARTIFDKGRCSKLGLDTIEFFHWDTQNAYCNRVGAAAKRNLPYDINKQIAEIVTYK